MQHFSFDKLQPVLSDTLLSLIFIDDKSDEQHLLFFLFPFLQSDSISQRQSAAVIANWQLKKFTSVHQFTQLLGFLTRALREILK